MRLGALISFALKGRASRASIRHGGQPERPRRIFMFRQRSANLPSGAGEIASVVGNKTGLAQRFFLFFSGEDLRFVIPAIPPSSCDSNIRNCRRTFLFARTIKLPDRFLAKAERQRTGGDKDRAAIMVDQFDSGADADAFRP